MPKSKVSALVSLLLVFISGAMVGAVGHRLYVVKNVVSTAGNNIPQPQRKMDPEEVRRRIMADYREKVAVDDQQLQQIDQIYDQTREQFDEVRKKFSKENQSIWQRQNQEIKQILRPEQVPLFEKYRAEREEAERKRRRGPGGPGGPGGGPPPK